MKAWAIRTSETATGSGLVADADVNVLVNGANGRARNRTSTQPSATTSIDMAARHAVFCHAGQDTSEVPSLRLQVQPCSVSGFD